jgi:hypothetical protein
VKRVLPVMAIAFLAGSPAAAEIDVPQSTVATAQELTPAVAKMADFAKASGLRTLVYAEVDDERTDGRAILGMNVISQVRGSNSLQSYEGEEMPSLREAISSEAIATGTGGWRKILIIVDKGEVTVERGSRPGPIEGFNARLRTEVDRAFPGHS